MEHNFEFKQLVAHPGGYHTIYKCTNKDCDLSYELAMDDADGSGDVVKRNRRAIKQMIKHDYPDCPYTCDTDPFKTAREHNMDDP